METITTFFHMGGYGVYVWPCFVVTMVLLVALLLSSLRALRVQEAALRALEKKGEAVET